MKKNLLFIVCLLAAIGINYTTTFAQITLPYQQRFNLQNFPPFWTQTSTISPRWIVSPTSNAGGLPNEMMASGTTGIGVSRLIVGPINTTGFTSLNLQFGQKFFGDDTTNFNLRVQSSLNGTTWTNEGFNLAETEYNCTNTINTSIINNVGSTTYIAWTIAGDHSNFESWFIDDIIISATVPNDVGITSIDVASSRVQGSKDHPRVTVRNLGTVPQTFSVEMTITGGYSSTKLISGLLPGVPLRVTFAEWNPQAGVYTISVCTQLAGDPNPLNDCRTKEVIVTNGNVERYQLSVDVNDGWNLVSIPGLQPNNQSVDVWWPSRDLAAHVYNFEMNESGGGTYGVVTSAVTGTGYWMKHSGSTTYNTGDEWSALGIERVCHLPVNVGGGWNLIGVYESVFPTENVFSIPPGIISSPIYEFSGSYQAADNLVPGYGYWVKTSGAGQIMIDTSCVVSPPLSVNKKFERHKFFKEDWGRIIITDAANQNYTLYAVHNQVDLNQYELPPPPPAGIFDIRFSSGRIAEDLGSSKLIEMNGVMYPVNIKVENMQVKITDAYNSEIDIELKTGEELIIHNNQINKFNVQSSSSNAPVIYSLDQNFPNPFNPTTKISWQAPVDGHQTLKVFDVLGNEVAILVNEFRPAGRYEATFDASNLASGIYIYKLSVAPVAQRDLVLKDGQAGEFIQSKKMILLR